MTFFCHSGTQDFLFWTFFILWYPHPLPRYLLLHPSVAALPREKGKYLGRGWGTKVWNKVQKKEILLSLRQKNVIRSYSKLLAKATKSKPISRVKHFKLSSFFSELVWKVWRNSVQWKNAISWTLVKSSEKLLLFSFSFLYVDITYGLNFGTKV